MTIHIPVWLGWTLVAVAYFIGMVITSRIAGILFMDAGPTGHNLLDGILGSEWM